MPYLVVLAGYGYFNLMAMDWQSAEIHNSSQVKQEKGIPQQNINLIQLFDVPMLSKVLIWNNLGFIHNRLLLFEHIMLLLLLNVNSIDVICQIIGKPYYK